MSGNELVLPFENIGIRSANRIETPPTPISQVTETTAVTHLELVSGELSITSTMHEWTDLSHSTTTRAAITPETE